MIHWLGATPDEVLRARTVLASWNVSASGPKLFYAPTSLDWTQQDGIVLHAFARWWNLSGYTPKVPEGVVIGGVTQVADLTTAHLTALDKWSAGQVKLPPALDVPASKALLVLWSKTDGAGKVSLTPAYGESPEDVTGTWTARDGNALEAFGEERGLAGSQLTAAHSAALKQWFAARATKVPAGWLPPAMTQPTSPGTPQPPPALPGEAPAAPTAPAKKDNTGLYVIGGILFVVAGGLWIWAARSGRAAVPKPQENPEQRSIAVVELYNIIKRGRGVGNGYWVTRYVGGRMPEHRREKLKDFGTDKEAAYAYAELWNKQAAGRAAQENPEQQLPRGYKLYRAKDSPCREDRQLVAKSPKTANAFVIQTPTGRCFGYYWSRKAAIKGAHDLERFVRRAAGIKRSLPNA